MRRDDIIIGWDEQLQGFVTAPCAEMLRHGLTLGKSGSGKTFWVLTLLTQLLARGLPVTVLDPKPEVFDLILALVQILDRKPLLRPDEVCVIAPFRGYSVPLNPLCPIPGVHSATQAAVVVQLLEDLGDAWGPRMIACARPLLRAVMDAEGSLLDAQRALIDAPFAARLAAKARDPRVREYLSGVFPEESDATKYAIYARVENTLMLPALAAALCARGCIPAAHLIESPLCLIDVSGRGVGTTKVAKLVGAFTFALIASAVMGRIVRPATPHATIFADEAQNMAKIVAEDLEAIYSMARSQRVNFLTANQHSEQIRSASPVLWEGVRTNVAYELLFRPNADQLRHVDAALPVTGRQVDPVRPDRLLSEAEERKQLLRRLANLKPREVLFVNHLTGEPAQVLRTVELPVERAKAAWEALAEGEREAWLRGRYGVPHGELALAKASVPDDGPSDVPKPRARTPRAPLRVLP